MKINFLAAHFKGHFGCLVDVLQGHLVYFAANIYLYSRVEARQLLVFHIFANVVFSVILLGIFDIPTCYANLVDIW